jgi:hypothetical protein
MEIVLNIPKRAAVRTVIDIVGTRKLALACEVTTGRVWQYGNSGCFPTRKLQAIRRACEDAGVEWSDDLQAELFAWDVPISARSKA